MCILDVAGEKDLIVTKQTRGECPCPTGDRRGAGTEHGNKITCEEQVLVLSYSALLFVK